MALRSPPPLPPLPPPLPRSDSLGSISSSSSYRDEGSFTTAAEGGSLSRRGSEMGSPGLDGQDDDTDATLSAAVRGYRAASSRDALTSRASWAGPSSAAAVVGGVSRPDRSQRALDSANDAYLDAYNPPSPRHGSVPTIEKSSPTRNPDSSSRLASSSTQMHAQSGTSRLSVGSSLEGRDRSPSPSLRRSDNSLRHDLSTSPTSTARGSPVISGQWSPNLGMGSARARRAGELSEKSQRMLEGINGAAGHLSPTSSFPPHDMVLTPTRSRTRPSTSPALSPSLSSISPSLSLAQSVSPPLTSPSPRRSVSTPKSSTERDEERARRVRTLGSASGSSILEGRAAKDSSSPSGSPAIADRTRTSAASSRATDESNLPVRARASPSPSPGPSSLSSSSAARYADPPRRHSASPGPESDSRNSSIRARPSLPPAFFESPPKRTVSPGLISPRETWSRGGSPGPGTGGSSMGRAQMGSRTPEAMFLPNARRGLDSSMTSSTNGFDPYLERIKKASTESSGTYSSNSASATASGSGSGTGSGGRPARLDSGQRKKRESDISERSEDGGELQRSGSRASRIGTGDRERGDGTSHPQLAKLTVTVFQNGLRHLSTPSRASTSFSQHPTLSPAQSLSRSRLNSLNSLSSTSTQPPAPPSRAFAQGLDRDETLRAINALLVDTGIVASDVRSESRASRAGSRMSMVEESGHGRRRSYSGSMQDTSSYISPNRSRTTFTPTPRSLPRSGAESSRSLYANQNSTEHHSLLLQSLESFERHFIPADEGELGTVPETINLGRRMDALVNCTRGINADVRQLLSTALESSQPLDGVQISKSLHSLLRKSDDQVRSLTEGLIAFTRVDRERESLLSGGGTVPSRSVSRAGSVYAGERYDTPSRLGSASRQALRSIEGSRSARTSLSSPAAAESPLAERRTQPSSLRSPLSASPLNGAGTVGSSFAETLVGREQRAHANSLSGLAASPGTSYLSSGTSIARSPSSLAKLDAASLSLNNGSPLPSPTARSSNGVPFPRTSAYTTRGNVNGEENGRISVLERRAERRQSQLSPASEDGQGPDARAETSTPRRHARLSSTSLSLLSSAVDTSSGKARHSAPEMQTEDARAGGRSPEEARLERRREVEEILRRTSRVV